MSADNYTKIPGAYPQSPTTKADGEPKMSILPHPAKSNNPADLNDPNANADGTGGLRAPLAAALNAPGPLMPTEEMVNSLEKPLSREELQARAAALNEPKEG